MTGDTARPQLLADCSKTLRACSLVCTQLEHWASRQSSSNSLLITLSKERIQLLVKTTRPLLDNLTQATNASSPLQVNLKLLSDVEASILEATYLLNLCTTPGVDLEGDDDAINAVYASMRLADHPHQVMDEPLYDKVKARRFCENMVRSCLGADAQHPNHQWGLPSTPPPVSMWNQFITAYDNEFRPRYVHTYDSADAVPYTIDTLADQARGSYGIVQKVVGKTTGEIFAAKSFSCILSNSNRKKILREIGCMELCVHPNLIALVEAYEIKDDPQSITIVTAPWAPYTLHNFLIDANPKRKTQCPWFEPGGTNSDRCIWRIMSELASAVAFLHERSIKHKDIKPQNILLFGESTDRVRPIITDVGETKIFRLGMNTDPQKSSLEYLAPEQLLETGAAQSRLPADVWQLGCCFAMLLAVARAGQSSLLSLWDSFSNSEQGCSCNIATDHERFMARLRYLCAGGSVTLQLGYLVVDRVLDRDPSSRPIISEVGEMLQMVE